MESVRPGTEADASRCAELADGAVAALATARGGTLLIGRCREDGRPAATAEEFATRMADPLSLVLVGTIDGVVTGWAVCHVEERSPQAPLGCLDGLYVEPGARCVGIGRLLLDGAVDWLERQGCLGVDGSALPGDRQTKSLFEQAGFKARLLTMHRELP